ncbi:MAG: hypothetical protein ACP5U1_04195 [Desulfomonilaceae bacterium]
MESKSDAPEKPIENEIAPEEEAKPELPEVTEEEIRANNHLKRGRLITSALLVAIVLTFISVLVAGIFKVTGELLRQCPRELHVNDPAPVLWNDITSVKTGSAGLGVPQELKKETMLKITDVGQK